MLEVAALVPAVIHLELKQIGKFIEQEAKDEIGHYQAAMGEHQAWPELADSTKKDRVRKGFPEDEPLLRTGELRDSISSKADALSVTIGSTSDVMVYQELGTATIPPRPVLGTALYKNKDKVVVGIGAAVFETVSLGKRVTRKAYEGKI